MALESTVIEKTPLTIVDEFDGIARSENGVKAGIVKTSGILGAVFDLEVETVGISRPV